MNSTNLYFAPGCALKIYKPELADKVLSFLRQELGVIEEHLICCRHEPQLIGPSKIINVCPGCDKRYRQLYEGVTTESLWEILARNDRFPFPDYKGAKMSINDACPTRDKPDIHDSIRRLLERMNIVLVEPKRTREKGICCGDTFFGKVKEDRVKELMKKRAKEMPCNDVVTYCVSCSKSMHIGGKSPRYIVDLLFAEATVPKTYEPSEWHGELDEFIESH